MDIRAEIRGRTILARLTGEIDLAITDRLRSTLENMLDSNEEIKNIVLNLSGVTYIDSSGLGVLLGRYKRISRQGGKMFIVGAVPQVKKILEMSGLFNIMQECPSEEYAIKLAG